MIKICYVHAAKATTEGLKYRHKLFDALKKSGAINPDTQIDIKVIDKSTVTLKGYTESYYFDLLQRPYMVETVIQAEKQGYDASILGCYFDPGLDEARESVSIPVVGIAEASFSIANLLARKKGSIALIAVAQKGILKTLDLVDRYGFNAHLIPVRPVRQVSGDVYIKGLTTTPANAQALKNEFIQVAKECIRDGAEIIIPACAGLGPFLATENILMVDEVPVLDPVVCAVQMAENLVGLREFGITVSRRLMYRQLSKEDWNKERTNFGYV